MHKNTQFQFLQGGLNTPSLLARCGTTKAKVGANLAADFNLQGSDGLAARAEVGCIILAWAEARDRATEESKKRAEDKASGVLHVMEPSDLAAMCRAYETTHGRLEDAEVPSKVLVSTRLEQLESNYLVADELTDVT